MQEFIPEGPSVVPGTRPYAETLPLLRLGADLTLDATDLTLPACGWRHLIDGWTGPTRP